ncbi:MAG: hypothetical protein P4M14_10085 [Gammaproteobacteria bacterium]|nr:hypothetical protein [Gammaproteobacteria bacterium]
MRLLKPVAVSSLTLVLFFSTFSLAHSDSIAGKTEITKTELCVNIPASTEAIRNLPFYSYSTISGYNECVNRCVRGTLVGICNEMFPGRNIYIDGTKQEFIRKITDNCSQGIGALVKDHQACPLVHCGP